MESMEFQPWPKIGRLNKQMMTITEKIDGTNAQIHVHDEYRMTRSGPVNDTGNRIIRVGSRNRELGVITMDHAGQYVDHVVSGDNYGFFAWCVENAQELLKLGNGRHYGEWWGHGIQRNYGIEGRHFSLFNARRWITPYYAMRDGHADAFPVCCSVVPILYQGPFDNESIAVTMQLLKESGSKAAEGFMNPEGVIIESFGTLFKMTYDSQDGKWAA